MDEQGAARPPYVFVSYASADRERVLPIVERLEAAGVAVWIDRTGIAGGASWSAEIVAAMRDCAAVLLCCSAAAWRSHNVVQEIQLAWKYRRPYLPLILERAPIPEQIEYFLEGWQWVDLLDPDEGEWLPRVLRALARHGLVAGTEAGAAAPTATAAAEPSVPAVATNLPSRLTSFVGREADLAAVRDRLAAARLVTLSGAGGAGKTRLALEAAREALGRFADGVWLVELAALSDPDAVPGAVAATLGVREQPGQAPAETLAAWLRDRHLLLVLDNCEHLIDACARLVDRLLRGAPALRVLATSRAPLAVAGEAVYRVPSLALPEPGDLPPPDALLAFDAIRLFVERGRAAQPGFALTAANAAVVATICARLDGIPLALELAAARLRVLGVEQLAERLDDRFRLLTGGGRAVLPRQQTLRAAIDWSYDLLEEPARVALRRLAVFAGSFDLGAAEAVCAGDGDLDAYEVLDQLDELIEKSLLVRVDGGDGEARFRLLETIREYGRETLDEAEAAAALRRHGDWYVALAEAAELHLGGGEQGRWLARLEEEHDDLRWALAAAAGEGRGRLRPPAGRAEGGARIASALAHFWFMHGHFSEGRRWLEWALAQDGLPAALRVKLLNSAGSLAYYQGDLSRAAALQEECLALSRETGNRDGLGRALTSLGFVALARGDLAQASALYEQALGEFRDLGDDAAIAVALNELGQVAGRQGDYARAAALYAESLALRRRLGDARGIAVILNNLGAVAGRQGDYGRAAGLFEESLALRRSLADRQGMAESLTNLALVATYQGDLPRSLAYNEEGLTLCRALGNRRGVAAALNSIAVAAARAGDNRRALGTLRESLTIRVELGDRPGIAAGLEGLARLLATEGDPQRAVRLAGAADALRGLLGAPTPPVEREALEAALDAARAALGEGRFAAAWSAGVALSIADAVAEVTAADRLEVAAALGP